MKYIQISIIRTSIIRGFWDQNLVRQVPRIIEVWLHLYLTKNIWSYLIHKRCP